MNYLSNQRLAKVTSHWVCEIRKITEFASLLLVKSGLPPVDTLIQISNELHARQYSQQIFTCLKSTIGKLGNLSGIVIVNVEHMPGLFLVFLLLTLNK